MEPGDNVGRAASPLCHIHLPSAPLLSWFFFLFFPFVVNHPMSSLSYSFCFSSLFLILSFFFFFLTVLSLPRILAANLFLSYALSVSPAGVSSYNSN